MNHSYHEEQHNRPEDVVSEDQQPTILNKDPDSSATPSSSTANQPEASLNALPITPLPPYQQNSEHFGIDSEHDEATVLRSGDDAPVRQSNHYPLFSPDSVMMQATPPPPPLYQEQGSGSSFNPNSIPPETNTSQFTSPPYPDYQYNYSTNTLPPPVTPTPSTTPSRSLGPFGRALALWAYVGGIVVILGTMVLFYFRGSDWADGAAQAGTVALIVGIVLALVMFIRPRLGQVERVHPARRVISILFVLALLIGSFVANMSQDTLHIQQGHALEGQQQWQAALSEYTAGGEKPPLAVDLARTHTSWGLALNKSGKYIEALDQFGLVFQQFPTINDQIQRAQDGDIAARLARAQQSLDAKNYQQASNDLDTVLLLTYCNDTCKQRASAMDATAYYNLGEEDLQSNLYQYSVLTFDTLLQRFPQSPESKLSHNDHAKALLGLGKSTRADTCSKAITYYDRLAKEFADTPEGQKAQNELNAPQDVSGTFTNITANILYSQIALVTGLRGDMLKDDMFSKWDSANQKTAIQDNGSFKFQNVPQGSYDLLWYANDGTTEHVAFVYNKTTLVSTYKAIVGPLCATDVGTVTSSPVGLVPA